MNEDVRKILGVLADAEVAAPGRFVGSLIELATFLYNHGVRVVER